MQALTLCLSRETVTIVENLGLSEAQRGNAGDIVKAMGVYMTGQLNESVERRTFRCRTQQPGESFDDFLVSLRELAKTCNFCNDGCAQKNIRDQIIEGLTNGDIVEDLLKEKSLTLETSVFKCRAQEAARKQRAEISGVSPRVQAVRQGTLPRPSLSKPQGNQSLCQGCGASPHPGERHQCPAFSMTCHFYVYRKPGHLMKVRRGRPQSAMAVQAVVPEVEMPEVNSSSTPCQRNMIESAPTVKVHVSSLNGHAVVSVLPDSGADVSLAGPSLLQDLKDHPDNLPPSAVSSRAVDGSVMKPIGQLPITFSLGSRSYKDEVYIYPGVKGTLLSWKAASGLGILPSNYPCPAIDVRAIATQCEPFVHNVSVPAPTPIATPAPPPIEPAASVATPTSPPVGTNTVAVPLSANPQGHITSDYPRVFDGVVKMMEGEEFRIVLAEDAQPFCVRTPQTIPFAYRDKLKAELDLLLSQQIIAPITEPTDWCAPIVVAPKKDSERIRLCVDLSRLNCYVKRERYQSATPAQAVADIAADRAKVFTKLDALKGYHQCPLDKDSQLLTTFITPFGRFKFLRAPYGISSISEHYYRRMNEAFDGLSGYRRVVDDVVIYDSDEEQHDSHVRLFLQRCNEKNITLNRDKWVYSQPEVVFAGFILSAAGYRVDDSITEAISKFPAPAPACRTDLRSFVGLVNQLSACTPAIASLLTPLRPLLSTKNEFLWTPRLSLTPGSL